MIKEVPSEELRNLGAALVASFYKTQTRDELIETGPVSEDQRVTAFSLAGIISEELTRRNEAPLERYVLTLRRFRNAMSSGSSASEAGEASAEGRGDQGQLRSG